MNFLFPIQFIDCVCGLSHKFNPVRKWGAYTNCGAGAGVSGFEASHQKVMSRKEESIITYHTQRFRKKKSGYECGLAYMKRN